MSVIIFSLSTALEMGAQPQHRGCSTTQQEGADHTAAARQVQGLTDGDSGWLMAGAQAPGTRHQAPGKALVLKATLRSQGGVFMQLCLATPLF